MAVSAFQALRSMAKSFLDKVLGVQVLKFCTAVSKMVVLKIGHTFKNGEMFSNMTPIEYSCSMIVAHLVIKTLWTP